MYVNVVRRAALASLILISGLTVVGLTAGSASASSRSASNTVTKLRATPNAVGVGQEVTLIARVSGGQAPRSGSIVIFDSASNRVLCTLSAPSGRCKVVFNSPGTKKLTAAFGSGNSANLPSSGTASVVVSQSGS
jgi:hypothetical protein